MPTDNRERIVTVCTLGDDVASLEDDWGHLVDHVRAEGSHLVVLPELPFSPWIFREMTPDPSLWDIAEKTHTAWLERLPELGAACIVGTQPVTRDGLRLNEAYTYSTDAGYEATRCKVHLPNEPDFWEASWYNAGEPDLRIARTGSGINVGVLTCTEMWFPEWARAYGQAGAHTIVTPRATWATRYERWRTGAQALALISGCYSLGSAKTESGSRRPALGGYGWIIGPDGEILGETSDTARAISRPVDLTVAEEAKRSYPRYVPFVPARAT